MDQPRALDATIEDLDTARALIATLQEQLTASQREITACSVGELGRGITGPGCACASCAADSKHARDSGVVRKSFATFASARISAPPSRDRHRAVIRSAIDVGVLIQQDTNRLPVLVPGRLDQPELAACGRGPHEGRGPPFSCRVSENAFTAHNHVG